MNISELLEGAPKHQVRGPQNLEVTDICNDSRKVKAGCVFVALKGTKFDSHDTLNEVMWKKPAALVVEELNKVPTDYKGCVISTSNNRQFVDFISHKFFNNPSLDMVCIGVTGTNGKTTTTYMLEKIFEDQGLVTGVIGTINHHVGEKIWPTNLTTPDSIELHRRLREFSDHGAKALAIEVTSHAIDQYRGNSIVFDAAIFTNLTRDHLDYHSDMENYFLTKTRLFTEILARSESKRKTAVINIDDEYGRKLHSIYSGKTMTFGTHDATLNYKILSEDFSGSTIAVRCPKGDVEFKLPIPCRYNVANAMGALAAAVAVDLDFMEAAFSLSGISGIKGRLERVENRLGLHIFVDYAHTDDALKNVLNSLREIRKNLKANSKIITVFGCGGDRDKGKRPLMAIAAVNGADHVIVTSDNPRTENPQSIINDVMAGVPQELIGKKVEAEIHRRRAIEKSIRMANKGDVVLIAGKGHEDYQIIGTERLPFSDVETVKELTT
jgi:UDP-N-acetylmuramoyl-L-alanyl-D-glutamate--2,6-diaminopimelate ligase